MKAQQRDLPAYAFMWVAAMVWHLLRIATFRPAYKYISDTAHSVLSFLVAYFALGLWRWCLLSDHAVDSETLRMVIEYGLAMAIFERGNRSSSIIAAIVGATAAVDLLVVSLHLTGLLEDVNPALAFPYECLLMTVCVYRFFQEPAEVQRNGYRRFDKDMNAQ